MKDIEGSNTWGLKLITSLMKELETVMLIVTITTSQGLKPMASWVRLMTDTKLEASQVPISQSFTKTMKENKKQIRQSYNSWVGAPGLPGAGSYMFHNVHEDVIKKYFGAPKTFTNEGFRSPEFRPMNCNKNANPSQLRDYVHRRLQGPPLHCTVRSEVDEISNNDNDKMLVMMDQCTMRLSPCKAVN